MSYVWIICSWYLRLCIRWEHQLNPFVNHDTVCSSCSVQIMDIALIMLLNMKFSCMYNIRPMHFRLKPPPQNGFDHIKCSSMVLIALPMLPELYEMTFNGDWICMSFCFLLAKMRQSSTNEECLVVYGFIYCRWIGRIVRHNYWIFTDKCCWSGLFRGSTILFGHSKSLSPTIRGKYQTSSQFHFLLLNLSISIVDLHNE